MSILISVFGILLTIFFVIGTHEAAHFMTARLLGVKVLRFSIGFGKSLLSWHDKKGTEYVLALIPLGGYVKMLDENEGDVPVSELPRAFNRQPFIKKFLIVLAGPLSNIFCALALYWLVFTIGFSTIKPIIGNIAPHSIAAEAGIQANQEITAVDGHATYSWTNILIRLMMHLGNQDTVSIQTRSLTNNQINHYQVNLSHWRMDDLHPEPLTSLGITPYQPTIPLVIGMIAPDSNAAKSSLKLGDRILALDNMPVSSWKDVINIIYSHPDTPMIMTVERQHKKLNVPVTIGYKRTLLLQKHGSFGIGPNIEWPKELIQNVRYHPLAAAARALQEVSDFTYFNLVLFGKMFTGKLSLQSVGGPITIFESAGDALNSGFLTFISFLAFLSISIGIINLLPIPGLDGGHLLIQFIEFVIRRPIAERYLLFLFRLGFIFLLLILIKAITNDILRLY